MHAQFLLRQQLFSAIGALGGWARLKWGTLGRVGLFLLGNAGGRGKLERAEGSLRQIALLQLCQAQMTIANASVVSHKEMKTGDSNHHWL